jgi:hypothetical protein
MDPVFMVSCPSCEAGKGEKCRRPSGHLVWNSEWSGLPKGAHADRDIKALKEGVYGTCPGPCPDSYEELQRRKRKRKQKQKEEKADEQIQKTLFPPTGEDETSNGQEEVGQEAGQEEKGKQIEAEF